MIVWKKEGKLNFLIHWIWLRSSIPENEWNDWMCKIIHRGADMTNMKRWNGWEHWQRKKIIQFSLDLHDFKIFLPWIFRQPCVDLVDQYCLWENFYLTKASHKMRRKKQETFGWLLPYKSYLVRLVSQSGQLFHHHTLWSMRHTMENIIRNKDENIWSQTLTVAMKRNLDQANHLLENYIFYFNYSYHWTDSSITWKNIL